MPRPPYWMLVNRILDKKGKGVTFVCLSPFLVACVSDFCCFSMLKSDSEALTQLKASLTPVLFIQNELEP
jgi:enhancing lycopene biosynthesis protein 2